MRTNIWVSAAVTGLVGVVGVVGVAHGTTVAPSQSTLVTAVKSFLGDHGDLCVGKFDWPRVVTQQDRQAGSNDAVQLPVLERLGLVESTQISAPAAASPVRRYSLTAKGKQYYLQKKRTTLGIHGQPVERNGDLCVARLSLDKVVKWSPPGQVGGHLETLVYYTYHIRSADWMADPQARKVFPIVDRIIRGQGDLLMSVTVQLRNGNWVPVLPGQ